MPLRVMAVRCEPSAGELSICDCPHLLAIILSCPFGLFEYYGTKLWVLQAAISHAVRRVNFDRTEVENGFTDQIRQCLHSVRLDPDVRIVRCVS